MGYDSNCGGRNWPSSKPTEQQHNQRNSCQKSSHKVSDLSKMEEIKPSNKKNLRNRRLEGGWDQSAAARTEGFGDGLCWCEPIQDDPLLHSSSSFKSVIASYSSFRFTTTFDIYDDIQDLSPHLQAWFHPLHKFVTSMGIPHLCMPPRPPSSSMSATNFTTSFGPLSWAFAGARISGWQKMYLHHLHLLWTTTRSSCRSEEADWRQGRTIAVGGGGEVAGVGGFGGGGPIEMGWNGIGRSENENS